MSTRTVNLLSASGVAFRDNALLELALTHASKNGTVNNQRLEFLGDRVLSLAVAHLLYRDYADENEGAMALRHAALVKAGAIADIARAHRLDADLIVSPAGKTAQTALVDNVLADTLEAIIGALYLDQGYPACQGLIEKLWATVMKEMTAPPQDPKNTLQEWAQGCGMPLPVYTLIARDGPDHAATFTVEVCLANNLTARGVGPSRRAAEKEAATALLARIKEQS